MFFTFLTITYNHESFILEHLESIKYQIVNFGEGRDIQLIIADDCSNDNTIKYIKKWIEENDNLFKCIDILDSNINQGTCKNFTKGLSKIKGDYFKALAGDDIFSKENMFEVVNLLEHCDIISTVIAPFDSSGLFKDNKIFSGIYSMIRFTNYKYKKVASNFISIPMTPGVFMRKELYTKEVIEFINKFTLIEDRSTNIKIYEQNNFLRIGNYDKIVVLYRNHGNAITKTKNERIVTLFKKDSEDLYNYVYNHTKSPLLKFKVKYLNYLNKFKNKKLALLLNFDVLSYRISFLLNYPKYKDKIKKIIEESFLPNEEHIQYIVSEAKKYE